MNLLGKEIRLKGLSHKGKNRVREHGSDWIVLAETDTVLFSPDAKGPWLFITPKGCNQDHSASRWVRKDGDTDFEIVIVTK